MALHPGIHSPGSVLRGYRKSRVPAFGRGICPAASWPPCYRCCSCAPSASGRASGGPSAAAERRFRRRFFQLLIRGGVFPGLPCLVFAVSFSRRARQHVGDRVDCSGAGIRRDPAGSGTGRQPDQQPETRCRQATVRRMRAGNGGWSTITRFWSRGASASGTR